MFPSLCIILFEVSEAFGDEKSVFLKNLKTLEIYTISPYLEVHDLFLVELAESYPS